MPVSTIQPSATPATPEASPRPVPGPGTPDPESADRVRTTHLVALAALLVTGVYLTWRSLGTLNLAQWWVSIPLLLLEIGAGLRLLLSTLGLWDLDGVRPAAPARVTKHRLAVMVRAHGEPEAALLPALAAALAVDLPHRTVVLDPENRPHLGRLCQQLGATHLACPAQEGAKALGSDWVWDRIDADVVAILNSDQVASSGLLRNTVGYFEDPAVAFVRTPLDQHEFDAVHRLNRSGQWRLPKRTRLAGLNRWNSVPYSGTGTVVLTSALKEWGGLPTESATEDLRIGLRLHRRGWKSVFHNEVLARGLTAADLTGYLKQAEERVSGSVRLLREENPVLVTGLSPLQRVGYLTDLLRWTGAWRRLATVLLPAVVLLVAAVPIEAPLAVFGPLFVGTLLAQQYAGHRLRRSGPLGVAGAVRDMARMDCELRATLRTVLPQVPFLSGDGNQEEPPEGGVPSALKWLLGLTALTLVWSVASLLGLTPVHYAVPWLADAFLAWVVVNGLLLAAAAELFRSPWHGPEHRASVVFRVNWPAELNGVPVRLLNASVNGVRVLLPSTAVAPVRGEHLTFTARADNRPCSLRAVARIARSSGGPGTVVDLVFEDGQIEARAGLALGLFLEGAEVLFADAEMELVGAA